MKLAKVIGSCVSTIKESSLTGYKMLIVRDFSVVEKNMDKCLVGTPYVAIDTVGAGEGGVVCVVTGAPAQAMFNPQKPPVDAAIIAIVDSYSVDLSKEER